MSAQSATTQFAIRLEQLLEEFSKRLTVDEMATEMERVIDAINALDEVTS